MDKHTPGPWAHRNGRIFSVDNERLTIANVARAFDGDFSPANGDVLAASVELLEAMTHIERKLDFYLKHQTEIPVKEVLGMWDIAWAALSKARGEQV